ncbi:DUF2490 domain-containing protein [Aggregatimonas sangjinii]|uniref:DUF2490 domain-containing protein n=1 Tax=Aggregatimonas sangjinii TaxID=2583587 RepID=A0A5B7SQD7_9FLAO|nr:DUF2490 domain-containing protein [Aggregatimonas sangjinii]QCX00422.1 DUF2490 domain-containing protein [Aggregatimonas sangjinii]
MRLRISLIALFVTTLGFAQETGEEEWGSWHMYFGTNRISNKLSIHTEGQLRYYEQAKNFNQLLLRTGLNYHINSNAIVTAGYAYINTDPNFDEFVVVLGDILVEDTRIIEHRIFEQLILKNKVWEFSFEHRYRLEQRFLSFDNPLNADITTTDTQHRARYRLQVTLPLTDIFFLNFYDEIFLNLQGSVYGQNRLYGALGINVTNNFSIQAGYLKNHFPSANFDRLQIGVFWNPDLRSKKE